MVAERVGGDGWHLDEAAGPGHKKMAPEPTRRSELSPHSVPDWPRVLLGLPQEILSSEGSELRVMGSSQRHCREQDDD